MTLSLLVLLLASLFEVIVGLSADLPIAFRFRLLLWRRPRSGYRAASSRALRKNNRKPDWVRARVLRMRALQLRLGYGAIAHSFNRLYAGSRGMTVCKSFVGYTVRGNLLAIERLRRHIKHRIPRPEARNRVWGIDLTGKADDRGFVHYILGILDHGTRRPMRLAAVANKSSWTILGHLFLAIGRFGMPRSLRNDNESIFVSRAVVTVLWALGIGHQRIDPGCPWMNGRIERFFGTLKEPLNRWRVASRTELDRALEHFTDWYATVRPHAHLGGATPWEAWHGIDPYDSEPRAVEWFEARDGLLTGYRIRR